jgi:hypothetical protein
MEAALRTQLEEGINRGLKASLDNSAGFCWTIYDHLVSSLGVWFQ